MWILLLIFLLWGGAMIRGVNQLSDSSSCGSRSPLCLTEHPALCVCLDRPSHCRLGGIWKSVVTVQPPPHHHFLDASTGSSFQTLWGVLQVEVSQRSCLQELHSGNHMQSTLKLRQTACLHGFGPLCVCMSETGSVSSCDPLTGSWMSSLSERAADTALVVIYESFLHTAITIYYDRSVN